jgi:hypothetical protein
MPTDDFPHFRLDRMIDFWHPLPVLAKRVPQKQIAAALVLSHALTLRHAIWTSSCIMTECPAAK